MIRDADVLWKFYANHNILRVDNDVLKEKFEDDIESTEKLSFVGIQRLMSEIFCMNLNTVLKFERLEKGISSSTQNNYF